ncbi:hypothetical protein [Tessaracoccus terricola]
MGIEDVLAAAHGVVRLAEHRPLRSSWSRAVKAGRLVQLLPGVVMDPGLVNDPAACIRAVTMWNPNAIIGGRAAAALTFDPEIDLKTVDVYAESHLTARGALRFHRDTIDPDLTKWEDDVRVTEAAATVLTAGILGDLHVGTRALKLEATTPKEIEKHAGWLTLRRATAARGVALALSRNPWSVAEVDAHALFRDAGLEGWEGNRPIMINGKELIPDIGFHDARIAFEIDSFEFHSAREAMERDGSRRNQFHSAGWRTYSLTPRQVREHRAETIAFARSVVWERHRRGRPIW